MSTSKSTFQPSAGGPNSTDLPALLHSLSVLPPEITHKILSDLSLFKILDLTIYNSPYVNDCILHNLTHRVIFSSEPALQTIRNAWALFRDVLSHHKQLKNRIPNPVKMGEYVLRDRVWIRDTIDVRRSYSTLLEWIKAETAGLMRPREKGWQVVLSRLHNGDDGLPTAWAEEDGKPDLKGKDLGAIWSAWEAVQQKLNAIKAAQLVRLAALLEASPGVFKASLDPSQEPRAEFEGRAVARLMREAEGVKRDHFLAARVKARYQFKYLGAGYVPYDRYLRAFLKVLARFPPVLTTMFGRDDEADGSSSDEDSNDERDDGSTMVEKGKGSFVRRVLRYWAKGRKPYPYPEEVNEQIVTVLESLGWIHLSEHGSTAAMRTKYTPFSHMGFNKAKGTKQPQFNAEVEGFRNDDDGLAPLEENELVFLEAWAGAVRYMAGMGEKWGEEREETVEEVWKKMVGT